MKVREGRKLQSQSFGKGSIFVTIGDKFKFGAHDSFIGETTCVNFSVFKIK